MFGNRQGSERPAGSAVARRADEAARPARSSALDARVDDAAVLAGVSARMLRIHFSQDFGAAASVLVACVRLESL
jgi:hypothetical protein